MEMKMLFCAILLVVAASMSNVALASSREALAPAPGPDAAASGSANVLPAVGSLVGASILSVLALCFQ
ncbi:hypothetical protein ACOSQ3_017448 [Xanthoceras sorbifolium]